MCSLCLISSVLSTPVPLLGTSSLRSSVPPKGPYVSRTELISTLGFAQVGQAAFGLSLALFS